jgi:biopolymer transport protein ExbD
MPKVQAQGGREGGSRRRRGVRVGTELSEINVVPLVDVMLVMLVIFMVTAPMMQRGLDVSLPESRRSDQIVSERLFVTIPMSFRTDQVLQVDDESVSFQTLRDRIRQVMDVQSDRQVFIRGDGGITYQELITVMDELKAGGVQSVGLITDLPTE